jgi:hypothetical protein
MQNRTNVKSGLWEVNKDPTDKYGIFDLPRKSLPSDLSLDRGVRGQAYEVGLMN